MTKKKRKYIDTDTNNVNYIHKSLINKLISDIIPIVIPLIDKTTADRVAASVETFHAHLTLLSKNILTDAACSAARVFRTPVEVNHNDTYRNTPRNGKTSVRSTRLTYPVRIGGSTTIYPTRTEIQEIISPRGSINPPEVRDAQPLDTSINGIYTKNKYPAPTCNKVIGRKFSNNSSTNVYSLCRMNLTRDTVLTESPNFMNIGLLSVHTLDELGSLLSPLPELERQQMAPIASQPAIVLVA